MMKGTASPQASPTWWPPLLPVSTSQTQDKRANHLIIGMEWGDLF